MSVYLKAAAMVDYSQRMPQWLNDDGDPFIAISCVHPTNYFLYLKEREQFTALFCGKGQDWFDTIFTRQESVIALLFMHWHVTMDEKKRVRK